MKNKQKLKVIHITHCSHSYFLSDKKKDPDEIVKGSWGTQVGIELKRRYPEIDVECWNPEKIESKQKEYFHKGIKISDRIIFDTDLMNVIKDAEIIILAVTSDAIRAVIPEVI